MGSVNQHHDVGCTQRWNSRRYFTGNGTETRQVMSEWQPQGQVKRLEFDV
jgi:hypothetical protein